MSHQFFLGKCPLELAQGPSRVALAWHKARGSTPFGVTECIFEAKSITCPCPAACCMCASKLQCPSKLQVHDTPVMLHCHGTELEPSTCLGHQKPHSTSKSQWLPLCTCGHGTTQHSPHIAHSPVQEIYAQAKPSPCQEGNLQHPSLPSASCKPNSCITAFTS